MKQHEIGRRLNEAATDIVVQKVISDHLSVKHSENRERTLLQKGDFANCANDRNNAADTLDIDLQNIRELRLQALKTREQAKKLGRQSGTGTYETIGEQELLKLTTTYDRVVCHFSHDGFPRCSELDAVLREFVKDHEETYFVRVKAEEAPFLVAKLQIRVLPTMILFLKGIAQHRIIGFDGISYKNGPRQNSLNPTALAAVLRRFHLIIDLPGRNYSSDEEEV